MLFDIAPPVVLAAALLLDGFIGDPRWLWSRVPHPVAVLGSLIDWVDQRANQRDAASRRWRGILVLIATLVVAIGLGSAVSWLTHAAVWGWVLETLIVFSLIAQRDLYDHVKHVADALRRDGLEGGRCAVSQIVGRDPDQLDGPGICRAAIESCSENFADGVVAPVFWYLVAGLPGLMAYKAVNTLDSMIGHKTERHLAFGWASARFDDLLNLIPSRLSGLIVAACAFAMQGADGREALNAMWRDARQHKSPNAGWPEAAFAGALGLAIAGPRRYHGETVRDGWMGNGRSACTPRDIDATLKLYVYACVLWGIAAVSILGWID
ncbi:MAG: cobalamin biosynthesis protein [Rhodospirillaceae bacterium]|jgi:adenosylcobinamide-phosphate synthase|nr:cobalamin biosynthesis protein [Rhodospirillaceae bacterium]MBT6510871.1 cobalamin biosynthesis protein [Rhodospirillaceae bacterium]MBT7612485.1 cobalamin biosynthesis protein [Rhodospirillaceae bacterium]MBT7647520.1 cobalamin biosynthesis protein [Rhodospirillaceae bacterium]